ncbi:MAG: hypothetical protein ACYS9X_04395 [Planctomycetota bacterium]|jgi:hypothetical protein
MRALLRLPPGAAALAGLLAGGAALLVALAALVAVLATSSGVEAELAALRAELAGRAPETEEEGPTPAPESGGLIARVDGLAEKVSALEGAVSGEHARRVEELEKALAEAKSAIPGAKPLEPDRELARLLEALDSLTELPSVPDSTRRSLRTYRKSCESKTKSNIAYYTEKCRKMARDCDSAQREAERDVQTRREQAHDSLRRSMERVVEQMLSRAREHEKRKSWGAALATYRGIGGLENTLFAEAAANCRKKVVEVEARMKEDARERGERERLKAEKAAKAEKERRKRKKPEPREEGGLNRGAEVF